LLRQPVVGEIVGLGHKFRGLAVATNGVIVALETSAGAALFGHLQWFEKDDKDAVSDLDNTLPTRKKPQALAEFADCFEDFLSVNERQTDALAVSNATLRDKGPI